MLSALESVFSIILMIAVGFVLAKRGWFDESASALLTRLIVSLSLPAYMIANLMGGYDRATLLSMLPGLPVPFAIMLACLAVATALAALFRLPRSRRGTFAAQFAFSNTVFIGLPVNLLLFGEESLPYALIYYMANVSLFWTIGVYGIARDGAVLSGRPVAPIVSPEGLKRLLTPPLLSFLASVALIMVGVRLPRPALELCRLLGTLTTPLSVLLIGIFIARVEWGKLRLDAGLVLVVAGRFLISPLLLALVVRGMDLPLLMKKVFLIQSSMPAMTQTPILAKAYGADAEYASVTTSFATVLSLAAIPLYMGIIDRIFP